MPLMQSIIIPPPDPRSQDEVDANAGTGCTECVGPEGALEKELPGDVKTYIID
jgi:hypothetical protein